MSTEQNKALAIRVWNEMFNQKNIDVIDELFASNYIYHGPQGKEFIGTESLKKFISHFLEAFPDLHLEVEDLVAEGNKVASRVTIMGTHKGDLQGIPPTGKEVSTTIILITRFSEGKVAEDWESSDDLGLLQQLGVYPK